MPSRPSKPSANAKRCRATASRSSPVTTARSRTASSTTCTSAWCPPSLRFAPSSRRSAACSTSRSAPPRCAMRCRARCDCVVISAYTSSQVWRGLTARLPKPRRAAITAVYAEPAPNDQMRLAELLYGRPVRVGVHARPRHRLPAPGAARRHRDPDVHAGRRPESHAGPHDARRDAAGAARQRRLQRRKRAQHPALDLPPQAGRDRLLGRHGQGRRAGHHVFRSRGHQRPGGRDHGRLRAPPANCPRRSSRATSAPSSTKAWPVRSTCA